jgi:hypothetical protein
MSRVNKPDVAASSVVEDALTVDIATKIIELVAKDKILTIGVLVNPDAPENKQDKEDDIFAELAKDIGITTTRFTDPSDEGLGTQGCLVIREGKQWLKDNGFFENIKKKATIALIISYGSQLGPECIENFVVTDTIEFTEGTDKDAGSDIVQIFTREKVYV